VVACSERFSDPVVVHCKRIEGGQLDEIDQCTRNLLVRFATLRLSPIRKSVKRIGWCVAAVGRFSQHVINSVGLLKKMRRFGSVDVRQDREVRL
jgi:hypothetical protein